MTTAIYSHPLCLLHEMGPHHPECPERIVKIEDEITRSGLRPFLDYRDAPEAPLSAIQRVHLLDNINDVRDNTPEDEDDYYPVDGDTVLNSYSWHAALRAAGAGIAATDAVIKGEISNAFCLVRPIGHHARIDSPMGYCVFNNVAIAAMAALKDFGITRAAIIDFDVHHGNGTEEAFAHEPNVLMASFYQAPLYPFMGNERERKNMVNISVPKNTNRGAIREIVTNQWLPALRAHQPEIIFISAGFDAHEQDPLGGLMLIEEDYAWMTQQLMDVAQEHAKGRIVSFLEGGYHIPSLARSVVAHIQTLAQKN